MNKNELKLATSELATLKELIKTHSFHSCRYNIKLRRWDSVIDINLFKQLKLKLKFSDFHSLKDITNIYKKNNTKYLYCIMYTNAKFDVGIITKTTDNNPIWSGPAACFRSLEPKYATKISNAEITYKSSLNINYYYDNPKFIKISKLSHDNICKYFELRKNCFNTHYMDEES